MTAGGSTACDEELLVEQRDFYRADAASFDAWLASLISEHNDEPAAVTYRVGRQNVARAFEERAPLGRVLEIAAGTGRLVELYVAHTESVVLLDSSAESLAIAARRLAHASRGVTTVEADVFAWNAAGQTFDTIVFSAWLHHVPHSRFESFWDLVASLLTPGGEVVFDFPDEHMPSGGLTETAEEPAEAYGFYAPVDGVSLRDHDGRRWRVVHNLWDPDDLSSRLRTLGWEMTILGPGLCDNMLWASAHRYNSSG